MDTFKSIIFVSKSFLKPPLTAALGGLLHGLPQQTRFLALQRVEDVRDGRNGEVSHGTNRQVFSFFESVQLLKHHPGNKDNRESPFYENMRKK